MFKNIYQLEKADKKKKKKKRKSSDSGSEALQGIFVAWVFNVYKTFFSFAYIYDAVFQVCLQIR